ncbi:oligoendopeptidase F [Secundilactobacillus kimchicus]|uniref:oligoendopeptidase F n=1 Tax=Secundilactobacillus kimchicus TaxID=528209 RepID=UPI0024A9457A|nr:oligoendopeptidase F [Secundilactobacillus kimchicus]
MSEIKQLPTRDEVDPEMTWDLTPIYSSIADFNTDFESLKAQLPAISELAGTLHQGPRAVETAVRTILDSMRELEKLYVYASLRHDQDTADAANQALLNRAQTLATSFSEVASWFEPELMALPEDQLNQWLNDDETLQKYRHYLRAILTQRVHVLSAGEEKLLASAGDALNASSNTFSMLNDADLEFPVVMDDDGHSVQLSQGIYDQLIQSTKPEVRKMAFQQLYRVYGQFSHTLAATLSGNVKTHNFQATAHHFTNAREAALFANHIPESVFDSLVDSVNEHLPLLHRYVALRKQLLGVKELHMYDLYTPIMGEPALSYTYQQAQQMALKALSVLGDDYIQTVQTAFNSRWIDVVENKGKRSGAYSSGMYDTAPYMLLNWQDNLENLFTLVHEMGHSMHSFYTTHNQPYQYGDYPIFVAEIASTTNENLLTDYLLNETSDPKVKAFILNHYLDGFKGTVFRQTQFAEFEHLIHQQDAAGQPLTADYLNQQYLALNKRYYGDAVISDDEIKLEWSRIPHFYYNYYVYQYATGFAAANTLANGIVTGKPGAREAYLGFLKAGSSDYPIEVMKQAGVDMTATNYLDQAFKVFEQRLIEFEKLAKTL